MKMMISFFIVGGRISRWVAVLENFLLFTTSFSVFHHVNDK